MQGVWDRLRCVRVKGKGAAKRSWINCVRGKWRGKGRRPGQCKLTRTFGGLGCDVFARQPDQCLVHLSLATLHDKSHARACVCSPYKRRQTCVRISIKDMWTRKHNCTRGEVMRYVIVITSWGYCE